MRTRGRPRGLAGGTMATHHPQPKKRKTSKAREQLEAIIAAGRQSDVASRVRACQQLAAVMGELNSEQRLQCLTKWPAAKCERSHVFPDQILWPRGEHSLEVVLTPDNPVYALSEAVAGCVPILLEDEHPSVRTAALAVVAAAMASDHAIRTASAQLLVDMSTDDSPAVRQAALEHLDARAEGVAMADEHLRTLATHLAAVDPSQRHASARVLGKLSMRSHQALCEALDALSEAAAKGDVDLSRECVRAAARLGRAHPDHLQSVVRAVPGSVGLLELHPGRAVYLAAVVACSAASYPARSQDGESAVETHTLHRCKFPGVSRPLEQRLPELLALHPSVTRFIHGGDGDVVGRAWDVEARTVLAAVSAALGEATSAREQGSPFESRRILASLCRNVRGLALPTLGQVVLSPARAMLRSAIEVARGLALAHVSAAFAHARLTADGPKSGTAEAMVEGRSLGRRVCTIAGRILHCHTGLDDGLQAHLRELISWGERAVLADALAEADLPPPAPHWSQGGELPLPRRKGAVCCRWPPVAHALPVRPDWPTRFDVVICLHHWDNLDASTCNVVVTVGRSVLRTRVQPFHVCDQQLAAQVVRVQLTVELVWPADCAAEQIHVDAELVWDADGGGSAPLTGRGGSLAIPVTHFTAALL